MKRWYPVSGLPPLMRPVDPPGRPAGAEPGRQAQRPAVRALDLDLDQREPERQRAEDADPDPLVHGAAAASWASTTASAGPLPGRSAPGQGRAVLGHALGEGRDGGGRRVGRVHAVAQPLEVAGVQHLLELAGERDGQRRHAQVDALGQQRVAAPRHHRAGGAQVVDEGRLGEGAVEDPALAHVRVEVAPEPVDAALEARRGERPGQALVALGRLVHEQVRRRARAPPPGSPGAAARAPAWCGAAAPAGGRRSSRRSGGSRAASSAPAPGPARSRPGSPR